MAVGFFYLLRVSEIENLRMEDLGIERRIDNLSEPTY